MRLSLRFVIPLMLTLAAFAYALTPFVDQLTLRWFVRDLDIRASLVANTIHDPLFEQLAAGRKAKTGEFFNRITQDERLYAMAFCAAPEAVPLASKSLPIELRC
jgi:trehalose 6-phosphate synthase